MAAKLILPGYGGQYTSEAFTSSSAAGADTFDLSRCNSFSVQIGTTTCAGTISIEQTFDGTNWAVMGNTIAVTTTGTVAAFSADSLPFGRCRINATDISSGNLAGVTITGFENVSNP